ncbi:hypothetical protein [Mangrovivirga cuniculi]|uniref:Uncharacterized protein n=1 Tax=Mangrovivirga cuniculi TaxID=2715131 RepID=A0A4D7JLR8_9BACT|nr:hypothetical protein [Mangrovivirga cuniculi]QCK15587.1 hypothetical protein DCC35_12930 [Mangrovivirga cuniculi]
MKYILPALLLFTLFSCDDKEATPKYETQNYTILFGDKEAGYFNSSKTEDGKYNFVYEFNDRGRGPHLEETVILND